MRTKLMKLAFLVDLALVERGEKPLFQWVRWHYGPFSREVLDILEELEEEGIVEIRWDADPYRLRVYRVEYRALPARVRQPPGHIRDAIEEVVRRWGSATLDEILRYVYQLPVVRGKRLGEVIEL